MESSLGRRGSIRSWLPVVLLGLVMLAFLERSGRSLVASLLLPTGSAMWIWAASGDLIHQPRAFWAVKDFDLDLQPVSARLLSLADEEAVIFLNGEPVGAGRYVDGAHVTAYEVSDLVLPGGNRLLVELRSARGVGGLLLCLAVEGGGEKHTVVSDSSWRIYHRQEEALLATGSPLVKGEEPLVWGAPPAGRWSVPWRIRRLPTIGDLLVAERPEPAQRAQVGERKGHWQPLRRSDRWSAPLGSFVTFDWGRAVTGHLALRFPGDVPLGQRPLGLLFVGMEPPVVEESRPSAHLIAMQGQRVWLDSEPRSFRYATLVGLIDTNGAEVYLTDAVRSPPPATEAELSRGAFGLQSARLRTPLENEIWSELHRLASTARGEVR